MNTGQQPKIFLVDDDAFCRGEYKQYLHNLGYDNVTAFETGFGCLARMDEHPDVIFLDHSLGDMTGLDVLKKIKPDLQDTFVVYLSGNATVLTAVTALKAGARHYIVKGMYTLDNMRKAMAQFEAEDAEDTANLAGALNVCANAVCSGHSSRQQRQKGLAQV